MVDYTSEYKTDETTQTDKRTIPYISVMGVVLIAVGAFLAIFVMIQLFLAYQDIESVTFSNAIAEKLDGTSFLVINEQNSITIGDGAASMIGVFFVFLIAWTGINVAHTLIRSGVQIVYPSIRSDIKSMKLQIAYIAEAMQKK